ncbi:hypothetical protein GOC60_04700 [Sinorhizobium meliloti]|nr:hypothetical protein [Sinorhizobium meliloti]MDX0347796.1 hypothetical protein [Sinorhizobium meliloti]
MKDAIGNEINPGDIVAYSRRVGSSLSIERRRVHSLRDPGAEQGGVKMYQQEYQQDAKGAWVHVDTDKPSSAWASSSSMVVVERWAE